MKRELLDKIEDLNFWHRKQETGIERRETRELLGFLGDPRTALVIAGVRRAGKTFLARQVLEKALEKTRPEQTLYINFEDPSLEPFLNVESLETLYRTYRYFLNREGFAYIVLDEVHNVPKWEKWVSIMMEKGEHTKFIITGSSSKVFKSELARVLTGRSVVFFLFPLSFGEFLEFKDYKLKQHESYHSLSMLLNEYLEYGGFPLVALADRGLKNIYLKSLFDDIVMKDIIIKYSLRETGIKKLAVLLINNFSSLVSVKRMGNLMENVAKTRISPTTVNRYLHYVEESFLFFFVPIFSYKIKDVMQYPRKVYCTDTGLVNAVMMKFSENMGRLYENAVALELLRRHGNENIFYWKDQKSEVDFVVKEGLKVEKLVQVCYGLEGDKTKNREVDALLKAGNELKCGDLSVITEDCEAQEKIKGKKVKYIPLWKWLLARQ